MDCIQTLPDSRLLNCHQPDRLINGGQSFCAWDEGCWVGIHKLDDQHKALFATLNRLHDHLMSHGISALIDKELSNLIRQTKIHFKTEEEIMLTHGYPDYALHKIMHELLLQQLVDVQALEANDYSKSWIERLELTEFLHAWLVSHIIDEDKKIGAFVRDRKAG